MSGNELATADGVLRFAALQRDRARKQFEREGRFGANGFGTVAHVFLTHRVIPAPDPSDVEAWRTGEPLPAVVPERITLPARVAAMLRTANRFELGGEVMGKTLRTYAELGRADGVLVLSEQWWGHVESDDEAEVRRLRAERPARIEAWPSEQRREVIWVRLEHRLTGVRTWLAEIHRNPTRLGPWGEPKLVGLEGHFVEIIPREVWAS